MNRKTFGGLLVAAITVMACGSGGQVQRAALPDIDGVFAHRVGQLEVFILVEAEREGNTGILLNADEDLLRRYIPETGFRHTANAFLVRAPGRNILIDTGTGAGGVIVDKINRLGIDPGDIDTVLLTHLHFDHFGGLQADGRANFPNAKVYLSERELAYFTVMNVNEAAVTALALYEVETFAPGELGSSLSELLPGISPIANFGHTPGHTVFLVENGNERLIIAGDFLHLALVQFAHPDISATFDVDPQAAALSRRQILDYAARNNIPIGGMHIVYPGIGTVTVASEGFTFTPLQSHPAPD